MRMRFAYIRSKSQFVASSVPFQPILLYFLSLPLHPNKPLQFRGFTPFDCWNKIYKRIKKIQTSRFDGSSADGGKKINKTGFNVWFLQFRSCEVYTSIPLWGPFCIVGP